MEGRAAFGVGPVPSLSRMRRLGLGCMDLARCRPPLTSKPESFRARLHDAIGRRCCGSARVFAARRRGDGQGKSWRRTRRGLLDCDGPFRIVLEVICGTLAPGTMERERENETPTLKMAKVNNATDGEKQSRQHDGRCEQQQQAKEGQRTSCWSSVIGRAAPP